VNAFLISNKCYVETDSFPLLSLLHPQVYNTREPVLQEVDSWLRQEVIFFSRILDWLLVPCSLFSVGARILSRG
jgi:hypothetical protein